MKHSDMGINILGWLSLGLGAILVIFCLTLGGLYIVSDVEDIETQNMTISEARVIHSRFSDSIEVTLVNQRFIFRIQDESFGSYEIGSSVEAPVRIRKLGGRVWYTQIWWRGTWQRAEVLCE